MLQALMAYLDAWKLVLPLADRESTLYEAHNEPQADHLRIGKTHSRLANYYYWPGYFYDTPCYVKACQECQAHKGVQQAPAGLMGKRNIEGQWPVVSAKALVKRRI